MKRREKLEQHLPPGGYVREVVVDRSRVDAPDAYPFTIPAVRALERLALHPQVTFLVGENGSGKSTLIEAIAVACGLNAEGGSKHFRFETRASTSQLHRALTVVRGALRERDAYFLRAESFYNVATQVDENASALKAVGGRSLHEMSHGESFLQLATNRFFGRGLYVLDEPEAALSPSRQLAFLKVMHDLTGEGRSQFVIATHSPILLAFPAATIYLLGREGIETVRYEDTEHYRLTRDFLADPGAYLRRLFAPP